MNEIDEEIVDSYQKKKMVFDKKKLKIYWVEFLTLLVMSVPAIWSVFVPGLSYLFKVPMGILGVWYLTMFFRKLTKHVLYIDNVTVGVTKSEFREDRLKEILNKKNKN